MTNIGDYPQEEFVSDFSLDFGNNTRGEWIVNVQHHTIGVLVAHRTENGEIHAYSVYWTSLIEATSTPVVPSEKQVPT